MSKFKVGDRVQTDGGYGFDPNEGTVVGEINNLVTVRLDEIPSGENKATWSYYPSELLPVATASVATATGRFKVGDRVRYSDLKCAGVGVVTGPNEDDSWFVRVEDRHRDHCPFDGNTTRIFKESNLESATLTIQAGRYYRTRDGRKVGPMRHEGWSDEAMHPWEADDDDLPYIWADDGTEIDSDIDDSADLVAEASSSDNGSAGQGSTAGFTVPLCAYEDEPGWYVTELGRAYADGYAAGLRAAA